MPVGKQPCGPWHLTWVIACSFHHQNVHQVCGFVFVFNRCYGNPFRQSFKGLAFLSELQQGLAASGLSLMYFSRKGTASWRTSRTLNSECRETVKPKGSHLHGDASAPALKSHLTTCIVQWSDCPPTWSDWSRASDLLGEVNVKKINK